MTFRKTIFKMDGKYTDSLYYYCCENEKQYTLLVDI